MATLYQYWNTSDDGYLAVAASTVRAGQSFTVTTDHIVTSVKLKCWRVGSPGTVTIYIYATDGSGWPTGSALATGTTNGDTLDLGTLVVPVVGSWREITFTTGALLRAGTKYAIVASAPGAVNPTDMFMWRQDAGQGYAYGTGLYSSDSGSSWSNYAGDLMFEDWGDAEGSGGGGAIYPTDALKRASGIRRTFWAGLGGQSVYQCELALGGMSTTYVSPIGSRDIPSAAEPVPPPETGYRLQDYGRWLSGTTVDIQIKLFGHSPPTYNEWIEWKKTSLELGYVPWSY